MLGVKKDGDVIYKLKPTSESRLAEGESSEKLEYMVREKEERVILGHCSERMIDINWQKDV